MDSILHQPAELVQEEAKRAALYTILSEAFSSPVGRRPFAEELSELAEDLPDAIAPPARKLAKAGLASGDAGSETISRDYARMFLAPSEALIPPYASIYLDPEGRIMGEVSREVAGYYAEMGLAPEGECREAPDHVAVEWEFMRVLTCRYCETGDRTWLNQRENFRENHLLRWMHLFAEDMSSHAETSFYQTLAELLQAVCRERY